MPSFDPVKYFGEESSKYAKLLRGIFQCTSPEALKKIEPIVERKYLKKVIDEREPSRKLRAADVDTGAGEKTRIVCFDKKKPQSRELWLDLQAQWQLDNNPERLQWLRNLLQFMEERGTPITHSPSVPDDSRPGRVLDLHSLFNLTMIQAGGMRLCTDNEGWADIARRMDFPIEKAYVLPRLYKKLLLPFEEHQKHQVATATNRQGRGDRRHQRQWQSPVQSGKRKIVFEENGNEAGAVKDLRAHLNCRQGFKQPRRSVFNRLGMGGQELRLKKKKKRGVKRLYD